MSLTSWSVRFKWIPSYTDFSSTLDRIRYCTRPSILNSACMLYSLRVIALLGRDSELRPFLFPLN
jgi:hypothetical protein